MSRPEAIVSVCIPAYNEEANILRCLESVSAQQGVQIGEIMVGINCSTDRTREIVEAYSRIDGRVRVVDSPKGKSNAWNALNEAAGNELRIFQDGDTTSAPGSYRGLLDELGENDLVGASVERNSRDKNLMVKAVYFPSRYLYPYPVVNGNLYLINYPRMLAAMKKNAGLASMPVDTINDDMFLHLMADKVNISEKVFVRLEASDSVKQELVRFKRMNLGNLMLKERYPALYEKVEKSNCSVSKSTQILYTLKQANVAEKAVFPFMMALKFVVFKYIHARTRNVDTSSGVVWK